MARFWCETCDGAGIIDQTLGGQCPPADPSPPCPDCGGNGYWESPDDAVAEYIAANDEYDAGRKSLLDFNAAGNTDGPEFIKRCQRCEKASERRALAHARMKGET